MIWLAILLEVVLLALALWLCLVIGKLFFVKGYRNYPPFVPSFGQTKKLEFARIAKLLKESSTSMTILDPGCGTADLLIKLAKAFPQHSFVGIEWNKGLYKTAKIKSRKLKNVTLLCQDMFDYSFADADIIVCFLMAPLMERFGEKVKSECKKGVLVYSNTFSIANLPLIEEIKTRKFLMFGNLYIYKL
ncbi:MAG: class I SAM-dependent methyltransferase [Alphaproteobacteria bacterium]|nr:class I SAM-dependent methyltransferase [Alphaproteobacteria bacterium]